MRFTSLLTALVVASSARGAESIWTSANSGLWSDATRWSAGVPRGSVDARFGLRASAVPFDVELSGLSLARSLIVENEHPRLMSPGAGAALFIEDLIVEGGSNTPPLLRLDQVTLVASTSIQVGGDAGGGSVVCGEGGAMLAPNILVGGLTPSSLRVEGGGSATLSGIGLTRDLKVGDAGIGELVVEAGGLVDATSASLSVVGADGGEGSLRIAAGGELRLQSMTVGIGANGSAASGNGALYLDGGLITMTESGTIRIGAAGALSPMPIAIADIASGSTVQGDLVFGPNSAPFRLGGNAAIELEGLSLVATRFGSASVESGASIVGDWMAVGFEATAELVTAPGSAISVDTLYLGVGAPFPPGQAAHGRLLVGGAIEIAGEFRSPEFYSIDTVGDLVIAPTGSLSATAAVIGTLGETRWTVESGGTLALGTCVVAETARLTLDVASGANCSIEGDLIVESAPEGYAPDARSATLTIAADGHLTVGHLLLGTSSVLDVTLGAAALDSPGREGVASVSGGAIGLQGTLRVGFSPDVTPVTGTDWVIAAATDIDLDLVALERAEGAPPIVLSVDRGRLLATVLPPLDSLTVVGPTYVPVGVAFELEAIATGATGSWPVSDSVEWTVLEGGLIDLGGGAFVATSSGSATIKATLGGVTAAWQIHVAVPPLPELMLINGAPGLWASPISSAPTFSPFYSETLSVQAISDDGAWVVFTSKATNLAPGEAGAGLDVFVTCVLDGQIERISTPFVGPGQGPSDQDGGGVNAAISGDGRSIAYGAQLSTGPGTADPSVVVRDRWSGSIEYVAIEFDGAVAPSSRPQLSQDGRFVAFVSPSSQLVEGDTNGQVDVFLRDRDAGTTLRVSRKPDGTQATSACTLRGLSANGRYVLFSTEIGDIETLFRFDRKDDDVELAAPTHDGGYPTASIDDASLSRDGDAVVFDADASGGFVPNVEINTVQAFLHRMSSGETTAVSRLNDGTWANGPTISGRPSGDGRSVLFVSTATNLVEGAVGGSGGHIYRRDMLTGACERLTELGGTPFDGKMSTAIAVNADGSAVAFETSDPDLLPGDAPASVDVFLRSVARPIQGDLNADGVVDVADLAMLLGDWGGSRFDLDGDGVVGSSDVGLVLARWS